MYRPAELNVQELTVIPAPKLHVAPLWKLLPVMVIVWVLLEFGTGLGDTPLTEGGDAAPTVIDCVPDEQVLVVSWEAERHTRT